MKTPTRRLPRRISTRSAYWRGFREGSQEAMDVWSEKEVRAYYARQARPVPAPCFAK